MRYAQWHQCTRTVHTAHYCVSKMIFLGFSVCAGNSAWHLTGGRPVDLLHSSNLGREKNAFELQSLYQGRFVALKSYRKSRISENLLMNEVWNTLNFITLLVNTLIRNLRCTVHTQMTQMSVHTAHFRCELYNKCNCIDMSVLSAALRWNFQNRSIDVEFKAPAHTNTCAQRQYTCEICRSRYLHTEKIIIRF